MYKLQKIGSYLQIKIKVANNVTKVANTHNKVTKKPPQVATKDIGCKYFFKLAKKFLRVANLNLQVQINPSQFQIKLYLKRDWHQPIPSFL